MKLKEEREAYINNLKEKYAPVIMQSGKLSQMAGTGDSTTLSNISAYSSNEKIGNLEDLGY